VRLSQVRCTLRFLFKQKGLASAVDVFVDSGVFDGFGADWAVDHRDVLDKWLTLRDDAIYSGVTRRTSGIGTNSEVSPLDDGRRRTADEHAIPNLELLECTFLVDIASLPCEVL
jgi:hypothetical protein